MMIEIEALATKAQRESSWVTPDRSGAERRPGPCRGAGGWPPSACPRSSMRSVLPPWIDHLTVLS